MYSCSVCGFRGPEDQTQKKVLSIMFRPQSNSIRSFEQIMCPMCKSLITIISDVIDCESKGKL